MILIPTSRRRLIAALALALVPAAGSRADLSPRYGDAASSAPAPAAPTVISLQDLVVAALNSNLELKAKRLDPKLELEHVKEAEGAFDPTLSLTSYDQYDQHMQDSFELLSDGSSPSQTYWGRTFHNEASIAGKLPGGTQYQLGTIVEQATNTYTLQPDSFSGTSASITRYPTEYTSTTTLTVTQPLLKDFGMAASMAEVRMSQSALAKSRYEFRDEVIKVLSDVMGSYYEMAFGQENLAVKQEAVRLAEKLLNEAQRRYDQGKFSELDVAEAKEHLSDARQEQLLAEDFLDQRRNKLREQIYDNYPVDQADWTVDGSFLMRQAPDLHRDRLLLEMLENNPGYLANLELARQEDVRIAYAKNQTWPSVDLKGSVGFNGLAGNWDQAYDYNKGPIALAAGPTWTAGVVVQIPITGRTARAQLSEAHARKAQALLNLKRSENELLGAFATAFRAIHTTVERAALAHQEVLYAQEALDAEQSRMGTGMATTGDVAQAQKNVSIARSKEAAVYVDLNKGLTDLYALTGTLPEHLNVAVEGDDF